MHVAINKSLLKVITLRVSFLLPILDTVTYVFSALAKAASDLNVSSDGARDGEVVLLVSDVVAAMILYKLWYGLCELSRGVGAPLSLQIFSKSLKGDI